MLYDIKITPVQIAALAGWVSVGDAINDVELVVDGSMLLAEQGDDRMAWDTDGSRGSEEYLAQAPLDKSGNVTARETLQAIANELDGSEWDSYTPKKIANIVNAANLHVERSYGVPVEVGPEGLSYEERTELKHLEVAFAETGGRGVELAERIDALRNKSDGSKVMCGACGSTEFSYEEGVPTARRMTENDDGCLVFYSEYECFDGDDDPGVVCASCGRTADTREIEIDWR